MKTLSDLVSESGIVVPENGMVRCIFHDDPVESLCISLSKGLFNCYGCGARGSAVEWVMHRDGISREKARQIVKPERPLTTRRVVLHFRPLKVPTPMLRAHIAMRLYRNARMSVEKAASLMAFAHHETECRTMGIRVELSRFQVEFREETTP